MSPPITFKFDEGVILETEHEMVRFCTLDETGTSPGSLTSSGMNSPQVGSYESVHSTLSPVKLKLGLMTHSLLANLTEAISEIFVGKPLPVMVTFLDTSSYVNEETLPSG